MLWLRALIFTVLIPGTVAILAPWLVDRTAIPAGGWWQTGWALVLACGLIYLVCLLRFVAENGTPAILGEEPGTLVRGGLYRYSRNPMYVGVLTAVLGRAVVYLKARDPAAFETYLRNTPRWIGISR